MRELQDMPGKQLVIVHYAPDHRAHIDWISNRADIDVAKVVWARDMGEAQNRELLQYFADHQVWEIFPDDPDPTLVPYLSALSRSLP